MASSSSAGRYDVFLSFRGVDTRKRFVSHLYSRLQDKGIHTFKDDRELHTGDSLSNELPSAIEESKFAVVVISQNYASSRWCLDELQMIMELHKKGTLSVVPIFYEVDPSDVRNRRRTFAEAFEKHQSREEPEKLQKWVKALTDVADLTGVDSRTWQDEANMVCDIVGDISKRLVSMYPKDNGDIIGMDVHLKALDPFLSMGSGDEACMIGIWGMGGIGKTTIAKCLYDKLKHQFPFHCFIEDIKKIYSEQGRQTLQGQFLSRILRDKNFMSKNFEIDSNVIMARLGRAKVLAILDDVDELDQLQALAKEINWFGPGSIIMITTRDKGLLISHEIEHVHEVKCLDDDTAYRLFNHFASGKSLGRDQLPDEFKELSIRASKAVHGLPLALKVLGSSLRGRKVEECEAAISRLRGSPRKIIMGSLKVSYDGLDEQNKTILLTVACLFIEERVSRLSRLLYGEEGEVKDSLYMLARKALIDISNDGRVTMHDLIQEMAKEIVYDESSYNLGRPRFLWDAKEIYNVLEDGMGTDAIEGISLDMNDLPKCPTRSGAFENMPNLRFLRIRNTFSCEKDLSEINAAFNHFPRELRLLEWENCPLETLPSGFRAECLVELCLPFSSLETLSKGTLIPDTKGSLTALKLLDLRGCSNLKNIPDTIGKLTLLETLILDSCSLLSKIPTTIGNLAALKHLNLAYCWRLQNIPDTIGKLTALETLILDSCRSLSKIPTTIGNLVALKHLNLEYCMTLKNIPDAIGKLTSLDCLILRRCHWLTKIPTAIGNLVALKQLDLGCCEQLESIPDTIGKLTALENLILRNCNSLSNIPTTIGNLVALKVLNLRGCVNLENILSSIGDYATITHLDLRNCKKLEGIPNTIGNLTALKKIDLLGCGTVKIIPSGRRADRSSLVLQSLFLIDGS